MPNGLLRKNEQGSTELNFSILEIGLCLPLILSFNLKHISSNKAVNHDFLGDYIICVEASKGYGETLRPARFEFQMIVPVIKQIL